MNKILFISLALLIIIALVVLFISIKNTENPATDFEYTENEDGTITITKHIGNRKDVIIPKKIDGKDVTIVGRNSFTYTEFLKSIVIPDTVKEIELFAFQDIKALEKVKLSKGLEIIGPGAFLGCEYLSKITLPEGLKEIHSGAFENCKLLKSIEIPKSLTKLGDQIFFNSGLKTIKLHEDIEDIGNALSCTMIKEIVIPDKVEKLHSRAFQGCEKLTSIKIGKNVKEIGSNCFSGCNLTEIILPKSLELIYTDSFEDSSVKTLKFEGDAPEVELGNSFEHFQLKPKDLTVYYHKNANGFSSSIWSNCKTQIW